MTPRGYVEYLQGLYGAIFVDIARVCPHLRVDCNRDYSRLLSIVEKAGLRYFLVDLPAMGKHFDLCLSQRQLTRSGLPFTRPYRYGGVIPRHFKGLYLSVFDESGLLRVDPCKHSIRFLRQLFFCAKRFRVECADSDTWRHVHEFYQIDREVRQGSLSWDYDDFSTDCLRDLHLGDRASPVLPGDSLFGEESSGSNPIDHEHLSAVQQTADICSAILGRFNPSEWGARHGPGAVSDLKGGSYKYDFPNWPEKLENVFPMADFAFANYGHWVDHFSHHSYFHSPISRNESPSRLIAVPKVLTGPRLIASEPVSHQWCQQIVRDFMMESVHKLPIASSVNFRSQDANGSLALSASHTESHATIDLSSASDRLSCWVVERMFRSNETLVQAFHAVRTRYIQNEIDRKSPRFHRIRKFTTMGSALTFPVQTYVFCYIAIGSVLYTRGWPVNIASIRRAAKEVRVFGDDIIVPTDCWTNTQAALVHLGLKVNPSKTFGTGKFRESCGVEAYDGNDVTKISILTTPDVSRPGSIMSSVDVHNNLLVGGYYAAADFIKSTVVKLGRLSLPHVAVGSGVFGWYHLLGPDHTGLKTRYNRVLQRMEVLVTTTKVVTRRGLPETGQMLLQYFTEVKRPPISHEERLGAASVSATKLSRRWEDARLVV